MKYMIADNCLLKLKPKQNHCTKLYLIIKFREEKIEKVLSRRVFISVVRLVSDLGVQKKLRKHLI